MAKLMSAMWVLSTAGMVLYQPCYAQQTPPMPAAVEWLSGPKQTTLGNIADLKIPAGFKFADAQSARAFRQTAGKPVPKGLLGLMRSDAGGWEILLSFDEAGYVQGDAAELANAEAMLKTLSQHSESKPPVPGKLSWVLAPQYNAKEETLEWAIRAEAGAGNNSEAVVNYTAQYLGRRGVLRATAVCKGFTDLEGLRMLLKGISFKEGQRYADFQQGERVAPGGLARLIAYDNNLESGLGSEGVSKAMEIAIWASLGVLVIGGAFLMVLKLKRARRRGPSKVENRERVQTQAGILNIREAKTPTAAAEADPAVSAPPKPRLKPASAPAAPRKSVVLARKTSNDANSRKKRAFDYNRYFADLMSTVSGHGPAMEAGSTNTYALDRNGNPVAATNGNSTSLNPEGSFNVNSEMIAHQTTLIEEQRRLIQEQTKLIEEKSRLIAEKNQLLKMQSEFIESKLL